MCDEKAPSGRVWNFFAGPAVLPVEVLQEVQHDLLNYKGAGCSIMEISHRSKEFEAVVKKAEADLRDLLNIPNNYKVIFLQGGGHGQFAAVPLNLLGDKKKADYIVTGSWSKKAAEEASKYCEVNIVTDPKKYVTVPSRESWKLTTDGSSAYVYFCENETVNGVQFHDIPEFPADTVVVCDISSSFCSTPVDITKFGVLYAGVQKNVGPAGVAVVIVREDLLGKSLDICPSFLDYKTNADNGSLYNTPPCWSIYVTGLVFKWLKDQGGLSEIGKRNKRKADILYTEIEKHPIYTCNIDKPYRSHMNVVFRVGANGGDPELEKKFVAESTKAGMLGLAGHRSVGGVRASIYNAMTEEGCVFLAQFMAKFAAENPI